jgi:zinc transporter 1
LSFLPDIGVIIAAVIMWKVDSQNSNRYYADPAASLLISLIIFASAIPMSEPLF